jgi:CBS domain containing-hemolysin-like protein
MPSQTILLIIVSVLFVLANAFFVAAEYSLVSSRRSRLESLAKQGNRRAIVLVRELDKLSRYVAGSQIGITMIGIGVGAITEPLVTKLVSNALGRAIDPRIAFFFSFLVVVFLLVVIGELVPKYATLRNPEKAALGFFGPLRAITALLRPLTWIAEATAGGILRLMGAPPPKGKPRGLPKEELLLLVQAGEAVGSLEKPHAELVTRALRLDVLMAKDIMIHRLDVKWIHVDTPHEAVLERLKEIPYSRVPVCRGDIDELVGVVYVHDVIKSLGSKKELAAIMCEPVIVPENLSIDRIIETMRAARSQILVVVDEYGGTSGIITIEDVVEEVFGDLEDRTETQRPSIEIRPDGRVSARADVRYDELVHFLKLPMEVGEKTDTLATILVDKLGRIPKIGDRVDIDFGMLRVENMARQRVTRVGIVLNPDALAPQENDQA